MRKNLKDRCLGLHLMNSEATCRDIATMLGPNVRPEYVSATIRRAGLTPHVGKRNIIVPEIPAFVFGKFKVDAEKRLMTAHEIIRKILTVVATEGMTDAILDDADEMERYAA